MLSRTARPWLPVSSSTFSSSSTTPGSTRSASPSALLHVGSAGQAMARLRIGDWSLASATPLARSTRSTVSRSVHADEQQVLAGGHPEFAHGAVGDEPAQRRADAADDLARRHRQPERVDAVDLVPTEVGVVVPLGHLDRRRERPSGALLDLGPEPVDPVLLDRVLQSGQVAVVAVAEVALRGDDRLDDVAEILRRHPTDRLGEHRVGVVGAGVGHAHAAAGEHHEAGQLARRALGRASGRCRRRWRTRRCSCRRARRCRS